MKIELIDKISKDIEKALQPYVGRYNINNYVLNEIKKAIAQYLNHVVLEEYKINFPEGEILWNNIKANIINAEITMYLNPKIGVSFDVDKEGNLIVGTLKVYPLFSNNSKYPIYNEDMPPKPGMYLGLFNGRDRLDQDMEGWGSNGPIIGPLEYAHTTYADEIKLMFKHGEDFAKYGFDSIDPWLTIKRDGLVEFQGKYYGDWTTYCYGI
jgi:hypothetical protein